VLALVVLVVLVAPIGVAAGPPPPCGTFMPGMPPAIGTVEIHGVMESCCVLGKLIERERERERLSSE